MQPTRSRERARLKQTRQRSVSSFSSNLFVADFGSAELANVFLHPDLRGRLAWAGDVRHVFLEVRKLGGLAFRLECAVGIARLQSRIRSRRPGLEVEEEGNRGSVLRLADEVCHHLRRPLSVQVSVRNGDENVRYRWPDRVGKVNCTEYVADEWVSPIDGELRHSLAKNRLYILGALYGVRVDPSNCDGAGCGHGIGDPRLRFCCQLHVQDPRPRSSSQRAGIVLHEA